MGDGLGDNTSDKQNINAYSKFKDYSQSMQVKEYLKSMQKKEIGYIKAYHKISDKLSIIINDYIKKDKIKLASSNNFISVTHKVPEGIFYINECCIDSYYNIKTWFEGDLIDVMKWIHSIDDLQNNIDHLNRCLTR